MATTLAVLVVLLRAFLPLLAEAFRARDSRAFEDSRPDTDLRDRLLAKVRGHFAPVLLGVCLFSVAGCLGVSKPPEIRTVYVKPGDPVRLREAVRAKVWVRGADGGLQPSEMELPEGWYALADPGSQ